MPGWMEADWESSVEIPIDRAISSIIYNGRHANRETYMELRRVIDELRQVIDKHKARRSDA